MRSFFTAARLAAICLAAQVAVPAPAQPPAVAPLPEATARNFTPEEQTNITVYEAVNRSVVNINTKATVATGSGATAGGWAGAGTATWAARQMAARRAAVLKEHMAWNSRSPVSRPPRRGPRPKPPTSKWMGNLRIPRGIDVGSPRGRKYA